MAKGFKRLALVAGIVIAGSSITAYTNHYITTQERMYAIETIAETIPPSVQTETEATEAVPAPRLGSVRVQDPYVPEHTQTYQESESKQNSEESPAAAFCAELPAPGSVAEDGVDLTQPMGAAEADMDMETESLPPEEGLPEEMLDAGAAKQPAPVYERNLVSEEEPSSYEKNKERLEELDRQIQQMRDSQVESTAYSIKSLAETEMKLWETEMNSVYTQIMECLNADEQQALAKNQRQWMNDRDAQAEKAAPNSSGGSIESAEYTASLASSTRQRAYDLLESYQNYLK